MSSALTLQHRDPGAGLGCEGLQPPAPPSPTPRPLSQSYRGGGRGESEGALFPNCSLCPWNNSARSLALTGSPTVVEPSCLGPTPGRRSVLQPPERWVKSPLPPPRAGPCGGGDASLAAGWPGGGWYSSPVSRAGPVSIPGGELMRERAGRSPHPLHLHLGQKLVRN